jgi:hypothetical protein
MDMLKKGDSLAPPRKMHRPQTGLRKTVGKARHLGFPSGRANRRSVKAGREGALEAVKTRFTSNASANSHITPKFSPNLVRGWMERVRWRTVGLSSKVPS